ncbi:nascent polypeptide-associated complex subunit alpha, muscle-specific form-like [Neocloeon triangulifer]|uniref:nascent polypeptide-associated complex subunit alpha, muscle-specific form-like n=1 Tax=Neocloeon triangulifer TaxID=2078957 RepID=UPI00286F120D|nr:nascent polypeptide-associated complex subunit alpha, muscle-specific form-like [Neocloeon triangulifer]XP_059471588.1 nascent polypeptide-associated complex subunit alpha, muscle-specific form-like [Neocloeon triangulifer]XP_059471589.1 nascent polypeptide-associated complex subunit alpha, muscle-specific form-like [Neocloeon triangulifer]
MSASAAEIELAEEQGAEEAAEQGRKQGKQSTSKAENSMQVKPLKIENESTEWPLPPNKWGNNYCCVRGCPNRRKYHQVNHVYGISFHSFPRNPHTCKKWLDFCDNENLDALSLDRVANRLFVCCWHFDSSEISHDKKNRLAFTGLVPHLRPPRPKNVIEVLPGDERLKANHSDDPSNTKPESNSEGQGPSETEISSSSPVYMATRPIPSKRAKGTLKVTNMEAEVTKKPNTVSILPNPTQGMVLLKRDVATGTLTPVPGAPIPKLPVPKVAKRVTIAQRAIHPTLGPGIVLQQLSPAIQGDPTKRLIAPNSVIFCQNSKRLVKVHEVANDMEVEVPGKESESPSNLESSPAPGQPSGGVERVVVKRHGVDTSARLIYSLLGNSLTGAVPLDAVVSASTVLPSKPSNPSKPCNTPNSSKPSSPSKPCSPSKSSKNPKLPLISTQRVLKKIQTTNRPFQPQKFLGLQKHDTSATSNTEPSSEPASKRIKTDESNQDELKSASGEVSAKTTDKQSEIIDEGPKLPGLEPIEASDFSAAIRRMPKDFSPSSHHLYAVTDANLWKVPIGTLLSFKMSLLEAILSEKSVSKPNILSRNRNTPLNQISKDQFQKIKLLGNAVFDRGQLLTKSTLVEVIASKQAYIVPSTKNKPSKVPAKRQLVPEKVLDKQASPASTTSESSETLEMVDNCMLDPAGDIPVDESALANQNSELNRQEVSQTSSSGNIPVDESAASNQNSEQEKPEISQTSTSSATKVQKRKQKSPVKKGPIQSKDSVSAPSEEPKSLNSVLSSTKMFPVLGTISALPGQISTPLNNLAPTALPVVAPQRQLVMLPDGTLGTLVSNPLAPPLAPINIPPPAAEVPKENEQQPKKKRSVATPTSIRIPPSVTAALKEKLPMLVGKEGELRVSKGSFQSILNALDELHYRVDYRGHVVPKLQKNCRRIANVIPGRIANGPPRDLKQEALDREAKKEAKKRVPRNRIKDSVEKMYREITLLRRRNKYLAAQMEKMKTKPLTKQQKRNVTIETMKEVFNKEQFMFFMSQLENAGKLGGSGNRYEPELYEYCASIYLESRRVYRKLRTTFHLPAHHSLEKNVPEPKYFVLPKRKQYPKKKTYTYPKKKAQQQDGETSVKSRKQPSAGGGGKKETKARPKKNPKGSKKSLAEIVQEATVEDQHVFNDGIYQDDYSGIHDLLQTL